MAFRLESHEKFLKGIPRIARERIDRVIESLSEKPRPSAGSIHEARKDLKSLRALLRLARGAIDDEVRSRENIFFRDVGRSLSSLRDPQALLEALESLGKRHRRRSTPLPSKQKSTAAFIEKIQVKINQNLVDELAPGTVRKLLRELRSAKRRATLLFEGISSQTVNDWDIFVGSGLRRTYRQAKNIVWQFEVIGHVAAENETWHELRKCAKALGYQLRLLKPIWPKMMNSLMDEIDQLTDCLGDANDLSILRGRILDEPYDPAESLAYGETRRIFLQSLDKRKQTLQLEAFKLARLIYGEKPGQFERRLEGYWQIWRSEAEAKKPVKPARMNGEAEAPAEEEGKGVDVSAYQHVGVDKPGHQDFEDDDQADYDWRSIPRKDQR